MAKDDTIAKPPSQFVWKRVSTVLLYAKPTAGGAERAAVTPLACYSHDGGGRRVANLAIGRG
ncbi:hypothetical protein EU803_02470 [Loktanella sp. IMCC34160]|uniref:hypothetical protein n=1 Tax=Loktanella sp. IMCC34160 TaxID=2510646 RepID=UPI00101D962B|nr:hypothetical protein [Loktanella sp. IMCC34160]RYG92990.1 hypothetical protein EU803_02470 [Loktanella sp. IMCC34160]